MLALYKPWSRDHHYKKERPLLIEPTEEPKLKDTALESEEKDMKEKPQSAACTFHAPPQILDIDGFIKHQPITILADIMSSNELMNDKRKHMTLYRKGENEEKMISTQCLEKLTEISSTSTKPSRLLPTKVHNPCMLVLQGEPRAHIRLYCCPHFQMTEAKKIVQEMQEIRIIRPQPSLALTFYLQKLCLFVCRDKLFMKCHIQLNQLWFLMQFSLILCYFHDFTEEWTMMLKVFPDDDLRSTAHDHKKEYRCYGIHMTPTTIMPSISILALPKCDNVFDLEQTHPELGSASPLCKMIHGMKEE
ncbi:hypothetical protein BHE74_00050062 [Ensete ventricosum]|nr:hypothetical protein BHE74_00050062 [Ensete ventricosum]